MSMDTNMGMGCASIGVVSILLMAWSMAFANGPSVRIPLKEVHGLARTGIYRTSALAKLTTVAAAVLFVAGILVNIRR